METKKCTKCGENKCLDEYYRDDTKTGGFRQDCKVCVNQRSKRYYGQNKEKRKKKVRAYGKANKEARDAYAHLRYRKKRDEVLAYQRNYRAKNKVKIAESRKRRRAKIRAQSKKYLSENANAKVAHYCRGRLVTVLKKQGLEKNMPVVNYLGCSIDKVREHLEKLFKDGMTWGNHGKWHIDHIRPCASFDLSDDEQRAQCFHYTNLQPLWAEENLKKGSKY